MANRKMDEAIALLRVLAGSANPQVANHANAALAQAENFKERSKSFQPQIENRITNVEAERDSGSIPEGKIEAQIEVDAPPPPVHFIKGKLAAVDCSTAPQAWLSVVSGERSLKLHIGDTKHLVLLGADKFSCDWKNKNVGLNYRERNNNGDGGDDGDIVSLELQ